MKINDIINEVGFFSGLASKLQPKAFQDAPNLPNRGTGEVSRADAAAKAEELYGIPAQEEEPPVLAPAPVKPTPPAPIKPTPPASPKEPTAPEPQEPEPESAPEPEAPVSLANEPLARNERISVETPAGTMYKYPNGRWYQIPSTGLPTPVPPNQYAILDDYANMDGSIEKIPPTKRKKR